MKFIVLLRQLQTSDHRFHAMSALTSASSPENGCNYQKTVAVFLMSFTLVMHDDR